MTDLKVGSHGAAVAKVQGRLRQLGHDIAVDGNYGAATKSAVESFQRNHKLTVDGVVGLATDAKLFPKTTTPPKKLPTAKPKTAGQTLQQKVLAQATAKIGVMEEGGNNRGPAVSQIIEYAKGDDGEPWCVDFVIWCYGHAGSQVVKPGFPRAVAYMLTGGLTRTTKPQPGDIVRYTFDHTGIFVRDLGNGMIETIEGNTGAVGAVSDSTTGGDGVYRKQRSASLVEDYLHVSK